MRAAFLVVMCAACGRIGFDAGSSDAAQGTGDTRADTGFDSSNGFATPHLVQEMGNSTSANVNQLTITVQPTTAGDIVAVAVSSFFDITSITDDKGNSYASAGVRATDVNNNISAIWFGKTINPGATTITINLGGSNSLQAWAVELAGLDPITPLVDTNTSRNDTLSAQAFGPAGTSALPSSVFLTIDSVSNSIASMQAGSPFTGLAIENGDQTAYLIAQIPGTYSASWNADTPSYSCGSIVVFAPAPL